MGAVTFTWPVDRTCAPLPDLPDTPTEQEQAAYDAALASRNANEDVAVSVMWALSGRQFGGEPMMVRPSPRLGWPAPLYMHARWSSATDAGWLPWQPVSCGCHGQCRWTAGTYVHLPGPVYPPTDDDPIIVTIGGAVLEPDQYVLEGDVLYRVGGKVWPGQNLALPLGEPGTWSVQYRRGRPLPAGVDKLTGLLAKEFITACDGGGAKCRLPRTVVSTTQRGVTHVFDPSKLLAAGKTGLPEVDAWLSAVNPNRLMMASEVL